MNGPWSSSAYKTLKPLLEHQILKLHFFSNPPLAHEFQQTGDTVLNVRPLGL
jgi:hypothetical protein